MKRLTLLRHAKSSWVEEGLPDYVRPLSDRGLRDAPMMSQRLLDQSWTPDYILCSAANRTRQTGECVVKVHSLDESHIAFHDALYLASASTIVEFIEQTSNDVQHLMIIAHNPGLETLGRQLHPESPSRLATCALLNFEIHSDSFTVEPDTKVDFVSHDFPKND